MAESETRLETLEDEVKVLKGEVKRTLVDLRALLMREDSPLGDGALARRAVRSQQAVGDDIAGDGGASSPEPSGAEAKNGQGAQAGHGLPLEDLPGGPPQAGPGPIPGVAPGALRGASPDHPAGAGPQEVPTPADLPEYNPGAGNGGPSNHHREPAAKDHPHEEGAAPAHQSHSRNGRASLDPRESEGQPESAAPGAPGGSVYEEYRALLEETRQMHPIEDSPVGPPLDINLLSNLVYWTARAKQRVGEDQLRDILQLYIQSGHSRPELQDLLLQISDMVDTYPAADSEDPREWVELMFHLHGILTGGFPVIKLPKIRLSARAEADGDRR